jgi:hypothetical protein
MDKGIIIGAEHEAATRSNLPFVMFRHATCVRFNYSVAGDTEPDQFLVVPPFPAPHPALPPGDLSGT